jgi:hypothetical protein
MRKLSSSLARSIWNPGTTEPGAKVERMSFNCVQPTPTSPRRYHPENSPLWATLTSIWAPGTASRRMWKVGCFDRRRRRKQVRRDGRTGADGNRCRENKGYTLAHEIIPCSAGRDARQTMRTMGLLAKCLKRDLTLTLNHENYPRRSVGVARNASVHRASPSDQVLFARSRSTNFWILPVDVLGKSPKTTWRGTL